MTLSIASPAALVIVGAALFAWQAEAVEAVPVFEGGEAAQVTDIAAPQGPIAEAIAERLAQSDGGLPAGVQAVYAARAFAPVWMTSDGRATVQARALLEALDAAPDHALSATTYGALDLRAAMAARLGGAEAAVLEFGLTKAYLQYGRDVASGVLVPRKADREILHRPERPDPALLLQGLLTAADPGAYLAGLAPQDPGYRILMQRLVEYRRLARSDAWADGLRKGPSLRQGDRSERVVALRRRLIAMGDLDPVRMAEPVVTEQAEDTVLAANDIVTDVPTQSATDPALFDQIMQAAVERFQARHGLNQDGVVGPATRAALNSEPAERVRQIAVNLERMRWMNRDLGRRHVMVNLAGFDMALVEDGAPLFTSRVVIGKSRRHRTPEFSDEMEYMVVNPTWHVPNSIATEEILPELQADPTYLERKNMRLVGSDAEPIDWEFVTPATFPGRLKQGPGAGNALGKVKFMFPNDHAIYLHDTPAKSLFRRDRRAYSHGCVRVQEPFEFAYHLLAPQQEDPRAFFDRLVRRGSEKYVNLQEHVPVHLVYRTAWVDASGVDQFRADIYGRDKRVFAALEKAGVAVLSD
ncbi:MAG: L,D-transpeptidase family protein [Pseudomonadota bacterium]